MFAITQIVRPVVAGATDLSRALNDGGNLCEQPALMPGSERRVDLVSRHKKGRMQCRHDIAARHTDRALSRTLIHRYS
jgi:hypothetical protein